MNGARASFDANDVRRQVNEDLVTSDTPMKTQQTPPGGRLNLPLFELSPCLSPLPLPLSSCVLVLFGPVGVPWPDFCGAMAGLVVLVGYWGLLGPYGAV